MLACILWGADGEDSLGAFIRPGREGIVWNLPADARCVRACKILSASLPFFFTVRACGADPAPHWQQLRPGHALLPGAPKSLPEGAGRTRFGFKAGPAQENATKAYPPLRYYLPRLTILPGGVEWGHICNCDLPPPHPPHPRCPFFQSHTTQGPSLRASP